MSRDQVRVQEVQRKFALQLLLHQRPEVALEEFFGFHFGQALLESLKVAALLDVGQVGKQAEDVPDENLILQALNEAFAAHGVAFEQAQEVVLLVHDRLVV